VPKADATTAERYRVGSRYPSPDIFVHGQGSHEPSSFYAAFEMRCGVQARLQEYLSAHDHISDT